MNLLYLGGGRQVQSVRRKLVLPNDLPNLVSEFGAIQSYGRTPDGTQIASFTIAEQVLKITSQRKFRASSDRSPVSIQRHGDVVERRTRGQIRWLHFAGQYKVTPLLARE